jgi:hypothetical protein
MQTDSHVSDIVRELSCPDGFLRRAEKIERIPVATRNFKSIYDWNNVQRLGQLSTHTSLASQEIAMTVYEAGKRGGLACLRNRGRQYFAEIGKKGQHEMRRRHPGMAKKWGKKGGRPRKPGLLEIMGEAKK